MAIGRSVALAESGGSQSDGTKLPPIVVGGGRVVEARNTSGGLSVLTQIPKSSAFAVQGGVGVPCRFTATVAGTTSDGQSYLAGDVVESQRWVFVESPWVMWHPGPIDAAQVSSGPLSSALRWFKVYCDVADNYHFVLYRSVPGIDPLFDPHSQLTTLYGQLQLVEPVVFRNPVVDRWGGLVVRYPVWLAINAPAWTTQVTAPPIEWRGWVMDLVAEPATLSFQVDFTPDVDKPSPPLHGIITCINDGDQPVAVEGVLPAMPELAEQTEPGVNGPCMWTPPGPGTVTIQARVGFHVTLWASGFTEARPDYVWTSSAVTFPTGELTTVNLNPT